ncbi:hypothetical protein [uncultured Piscinibacter sp.]|uniref:hypothetical protein n=1 Tax=uncultured Piscinibacter sp. TaxID=1131835 RepID=UPI0026107DD9|nr:hypothetical protein [uncultured Piscinibacter sp.]
MIIKATSKVRRSMGSQWCVRDRREHRHGPEKGFSPSTRILDRHNSTDTPPQFDASGGCAVYDTNDII